MIRLNLFFAALSFVLALFGPDGYELWGWWGFPAYLVGAVLSVGPLALGLIARIRVLERYDKLEPQFTRAAEALSVASVFIPFLRAVNAVLAGIALGAWLLSKRRLAQGAVFAVSALIALGGPLAWLAAEHRPLASTNWLIAAAPLVVMPAVYYARNGGFAPRPRTKRPKLPR
ncbi:MAG: tat pathway signal sequence [Segniliparus sp.]|uniref:tat pathway signal sequence n=1 Tax=Segniliparus sp. TaxID=2804064 RepID=UPI003F3599B2